MSLMNLAPAAPKTGFMDYLGKGWDTASKYAGQGMNFLNKNHEAIGALGGLAGSYMQYDMGKKQYGMQKKAFDYNKMLSDREMKRQEEAEMALSQGFKNSGFGVA